ncbi:MAG: hypothetical protein KDK36_08315 [Leptospiraceae bacterium]|nr:hypothetical protein [Leptospiraceae bacterium]
MNLETMIASCSSCKNEISLSEKLKPFNPFEKDSSGKKKEKFPVGYKFKREPDQIQISYGWFRPRAIFIFIFAFFWNYFVQPTFWLSVSKGIIDYILIVPVVAGFFILYWGLIELLNKTKITVTGEKLLVRVGPMPVFANENIELKDLQQLYCKSKVKTVNRHQNELQYQIYAVLKDFSHKVIAKRIYKKKEAQYIEYEIEQFLRIVDKKVDGEESK